MLIVFKVRENSERIFFCKIEHDCFSPRTGLSINCKSTVTCLITLPPIHNITPLTLHYTFFILSLYKEIPFMVGGWGGEVCLSTYSCCFGYWDGIVNDLRKRQRQSKNSRKPSPTLPGHQHLSVHMLITIQEQKETSLQVSQNKYIKKVRKNMKRQKKRGGQVGIKVLRRLSLLC